MPGILITNRLEGKAPPEAENREPGLAPTRAGANIRGRVYGAVTGIDKRNLSHIVNGKYAKSADTALRLAKFFDTSSNSWMNLQGHYL